MDERLVAFPLGDQVLDPIDLLARHRLEPRSGLVEDELVQLACHESGTQGDRRAVRMAEEAGRLWERVHESGHILELALARVLVLITALAATAAAERVDLTCSRTALASATGRLYTA